MFDGRTTLMDRCRTADSFDWMPRPLPEMDAAKVAERERRLTLLAGAALTLVALAVIAFAVFVARPDARAERARVAQPIVTTPVPPSPQ